MRTLAPEEVDPVAPQVNRVQDEMSSSLDVGELNENIEKLTKLFLSWKSVIAFVDDVVVLGRDFDIHMVNLSDVLRRFEQYGMKLQPRKCQLLRNSVVFLGRLVNREGVQVPSGEITRIGNSANQMVAKPLYTIMGPWATFRWDTEQDKAFYELRQKLMEVEVIAYQNQEDLFIFDTDASNHAIAHWN